MLFLEALGARKLNECVNLSNVTKWLESVPYKISKIEPLIVVSPEACSTKQGFGVIGVTSGLTLQGFPSYEGGSLLTGVDRHGNFC